MGTADGRKVTIDPSEKKVTELFEVIHNESRVIDLQALGIFPTDKARAGQVPDSDSLFHPAKVKSIFEDVEAATAEGGDGSAVLESAAAKDFLKRLAAVNEA